MQHNAGAQQGSFLLVYNYQIKYKLWLKTSAVMKCFFCDGHLESRILST